MKIQKNWFTYFSLSIFLVIMLYILVCGINALGDGKEYPYIYKGTFLFLLLGIWLVIQIFSVIFAKFHLERLIEQENVINKIMEGMIVLGILGLSFYLRKTVIDTLPIMPESDFKTYYEIAEYIKKGTLITEGAGYSDYISLFPHVIGYSYFLSLIFGIFGTSVHVGLYCNVVLALFSSLVLYGIARSLKGKVAGIMALIIGAFWPSQILYSNIMSAEYLFTFLLLTCSWIFVILMKKHGPDTRRPFLGSVLHVLLGVLLAITSAVRPMGLLYLIAIIITIIPFKMQLPNIPRNDIPVMLRALEKGWMRCIFILLGYILCSQGINSQISNTIDRELASGSASFGYNLLVGLNIDSIGGWNEEDANLLNEGLRTTGSPTKAQLICRDKAIERIKENPKGIFNLVVHKFNYLWENDDYGVDWNLLFLNQQGQLTMSREQKLNELKVVNNMFYLICVFFAGVEGIYMWRKKANLAYPLVLTVIATVVLHLVVENQNRYHFYVLPILGLLTAIGIHDIYLDHKERALLKKSVNETTDEEMKQQEQPLTPTSEYEQKNKIKHKETDHVFDLYKAIREGHITITVSEAYGKSNEEVAATNQSKLGEAVDHKVVIKEEEEMDRKISKEDLIEGIPKNEG